MNTISFSTVVLTLSALLIDGIFQGVSYTKFQELDQNVVRDPVKGIIDCGSKGEFEQLILPGCTQTPCFLEIDKQYRTILDLNPSRFHDTFALKVALRNSSTFNEAIIVYQEFPFELERARLIFQVGANSTQREFDQVQMRVIASEIDEICIIADVIIA